MAELFGNKLKRDRVRYFWFVLITIPVFFSIYTGLFGEFRLARILFISLFFGVTIFPYFYLNNSRGRYLLLAIFLAFYFVMFFMGEALYLLGFNDGFRYPSEELTFKVDAVIALGFIGVIVGYMVVMKSGKQTWKGIFKQDWNQNYAEWLGYVMWVLGTWSYIAIFWDTGTYFIPPSIVSNMKQFAPFGASILMYLYFSNSNNKRIFLVIIGLILFEFVFGFISNSKEISFRLALLFVLMSFIFKGSVNKVFLLIMIAVMFFYITYFNAYRLNVIQIRDQSPLEAIQNIGKSIDIIERATSNNRGYKLKTTVLSRINARQYVEILVSGIESGIPTRNGETLMRYIYSFVPRLMWANKPILTIGNEFNREFKISKSEETFVPTTQLGEFYWNFKYPGALFGMIFVGLILGVLSKSLDLSVHFNLPRIALLLAIIYMLCARFEATFALQYAKLTRIFIVMIVLHYLFKQKNKYRYVQSRNK